MNKPVIFCDFDGTITKEDTVDKLLSTYANDKWLEVEELWQNGEIGSRECLESQIDCIDNISEEQFAEFINSQEIDEYFIELFNKVKRHNLDFYVVSDGFNAVIKGILENHGISDAEIFSNKIQLDNRKLKTYFPLHNLNCESGSGVCKCDVIKKLKKDQEIIYIGDGRSDICACRHADVLFAKGKLEEYCVKNGISFIHFDTFNDIENFLVKKEYLNAEIRFAIR